MPGEIVNVSEFGMAVETLIELPPGYELTFRLRRNSSQLELRGWIRWCRAVRSIATSEGKELKVFHSGVELDESAVEWLRTGAHELPLHEETDQGMVEVR
jgi:hypothetical protein